MDNLDINNFAELCNSYIKNQGLKPNKISKAIGCSKATLIRLLNGNSLPTEEMLKQMGILIILGLERYSKLTGTEKEKISETIGTISGAGLGFASITAIVSGLGFSGLSGAGIMSGLATLGGVVGYGAVGGILISAIIPVSGAVAGYGLIKGIKTLTKHYKDKNTVLDPKWEIQKTEFIP
ncbi:helix-turn-helix transcriptional regulator [Chryseobacterium sp.]|uniref:helix-turn-helix domain-containing protein n=1 Tax=Chryseobacterium sp. TaxID=1871047 RepID=UPI0028A0F7F6|nr:helix-turn-helix transcriptional regulator [Chryseobacterium sp.]